MVFTSFLYEELRACKKACDSLRLGRDYARIFMREWHGFVAQCLSTEAINVNKAKSVMTVYIERAKIICEYESLQWLRIKIGVIALRFRSQRRSIWVRYFAREFGGWGCWGWRCAASPFGAWR